MVNVHPVAADEHGNITDRKVLDRLKELPGLGGGSVGDWDGAFAALDMREQREITIAHASDSTGDQPDEYFEAAWSTALPGVWPERPARLKRWVLANQAYGDWINWTDGDSQTVTSYTTVVADDFNRADSLEGDLGSKWGSSTAYKIAANKLTMNPSLSATVLLATASAPSPDHRATAVITTGNGSSTGLVVRALDANSYYGARINATGNILIYKVVNGTTTSLGGLDNAWTSGATFTLEAVGGTLNVYVNGAVVVTATANEAALNDARRTGVRGASGSVVPTWDNYATETITNTTNASVPTVTVYNGAAAGQTAQYQRDRLATVYPVRPDVLFINHGHNYTTAGDINGFLTSIQGLVDDLAALYPGDPIPVVVTSQNPQHGSTTAGDHLKRMKALRAYAASKGWGYIPTFEAFAARPDGGADQLSDTVHPAPGTGRVLMAGVAETWIREQSARA